MTLNCLCTKYLFFSCFLMRLFSWVLYFELSHFYFHRFIYCVHSVLWTIEINSELHMRPDFRTMTYWNPKCPIDLHLPGHLTYCFTVQTVTFTMIFTCSWTLCPITFTCPGHCDLICKKTVWSSVRPLDLEMIQAFL